MTTFAVRMYADDEGYLPKKATDGSVGLDLRARIEAPLYLWPGHAYGIKTGVHVEIPVGFVGLVCPRSGLSVAGIRGGNSPGVIDPDYRGEIQAILWNTGTQEFVIAPGDRVAQLLIMPTPEIVIVPTSLEDLTDTSRGTGGFGSTGVK